jgi:adenine-specific DNA-methyltransferase
LRPCKDESVGWDETRNIIVEGDNLEVLKLLRKSFARRVKLIYIDPPYNTGNDLLYPNDYHDSLGGYLERTGQREGGRTLVSNPDSGGRYHSEWLSMMYSRLIAARELLRDDGALICTIDENELSNLLGILKDVFTEGTYEHVCVTIVHNPRGVQGKNFSYTHEYAIFVFRAGEKIICDRLIPDEEVDWSPLRNWGTESERSDAKNCFYPIIVEGDEIVGFGDVCPDDFHPKQTEQEGDRYFVYPIDRSGVERKWRYARQSVDQIAHLLRAKQIKDGYDILLGKNYTLQKTVWTDQRYDANINGTQLVSGLVEGSPFTFPKSIWAVYDCVEAVTRDDKDAIILDFFAGSGTTGHATLLANAADRG